MELIPSLLTSGATLERAQHFADHLGKQSVVCKDRAGFIVNALLIPYLLAAIRMVESGVATAEDIDTAMKAGCAYPMGPLALIDLIGLDTTAAVAQSMYAEFRGAAVRAATAAAQDGRGGAAGPQARPRVLRVRLMRASQRNWSFIAPR